jgi:putative endonuclease
MGRFYVGQTKNLQKRLAYHPADYSRALRNRGPWKLVYSEEHPTRSAAVRQEQYIERQKHRHFIVSLVSAPGDTGKAVACRPQAGFPATAGRPSAKLHRLCEPARP